jgi:hypothetical protein
MRPPITHPADRAEGRREGRHAERDLPTAAEDRGIVDAAAEVLDESNRDQKATEQAETGHDEGEIASQFAGRLAAFAGHVGAEA